MNIYTASAIDSVTIASAVGAACAAVVLAIGNVAGCVQHEENNVTARKTADNAAIIALIAAGVSPAAARCSINDDRSAACAEVTKEPVFMSSIRSDAIEPAMTQYEQSLLGKKP